MRRIKLAEGLLILTDQEYLNALRRGASVNRNRRFVKEKNEAGEKDQINGLQAESCIQKGIQPAF